MNGIGTTGLRRPLLRHSVPAGVAAVILSVILHAVFLMWVSDMYLNVPVLARLRERLRPMRVIHVDEVRTTASTDRQARVLRARQSEAEAADLRQVDALRAPPSRGALEPPPVDAERLAGETRGLIGPGASAEPAEWQPRQEIVALAEPRVPDEDVPLRRTFIPLIERVKKAPDVAAEVDREATLRAKPSWESAPGEAPLARRVTGGADSVHVRPKSEVPETVDTPPDAAHGAAGTTPYRALEKFLVADVKTYPSPDEPGIGYFRIEIARARADTLPVLPKDLLIVQDSSASIDEQRLHFCREGLLRSLARIGPNDRFNILRFREKPELCFPDWVAPTPAHTNAAGEFIQSMKSEGATDIFEALKYLLTIPRNPERPVVVFLVTDGKPTAGLTDSSDIIARFGNINRGSISVFVLGTIQSANLHLLGLLGFSNRGDSLVVTTGRWDIPAYVEGGMAEIARPVLGDLKFRFSDECHAEVYPGLLTNLYLDRALVLWGRYPLSTKNLVFQIVGKAGRADCDMVFNLDIQSAGKPGDKAVRTEWARQKLYEMVVEYAGNPSPALHDRIKQTAQAYRLRVPREMLR